MDLLGPPLSYTLSFFMGYSFIHSWCDCCCHCIAVESPSDPVSLFRGADSLTFPICRLFAEKSAVLYTAIGFIVCLGIKE